MHFIYKITNRKISRNLNKSIYEFKKEETKPIQPVVLDLLEYGYPESRILREHSNEIIQLSAFPKFKSVFESLKLTAAHNKVYSLSFPQLKQKINAFCMHKNLSHYKWIEKDADLNPNDYEIYVNPRIVSASKIYHYDFEFCSSFKMLKVKAKRPLAVLVSYFDPNGVTYQKELYDFEARVFCHEYDHLLGIPFIHWKVNTGDIELNTNESYSNLYYTIEYYKNRLRDTKLSDPSYFDFFETEMRNMDHDNFMDEQLMIDYELRNKKKLSYDDVMLIDIEKAIKKDLKLKLKRETMENRRDKSANKETEQNIEHNS